MDEVVSSVRNSPEDLDRLSTFFGDLDYGGDFFVINPHESPQWPFALPFCGSVSGHSERVTRILICCPKPKFFTALEGLGLAQLISLQSVDLDRIRPGTGIGVRITYVIGKPARPQFLENNVSVETLALIWTVIDSPTSLSSSSSATAQVGET
jgi:hypothetical protein